MSNSVLVKNRAHQGPMCAVLRRYGIGTPDKYYRGIWIRRADLAAIQTAMFEDPRAIPCGTSVYVPGTCQHNHVGIEDFEKLF